MQRQSKKRISILISLLLVGVVVLFLAWRPFLVQAARGFLVHALSQKLDAVVSVEVLDISFLPPHAVAENVVVRFRKGPLQQLGIRRLSIEPGFGPVFLGRIPVEKVEVEGPSLRIDLSQALVEETTPVESRWRDRLPTLRDLLRVDVQEIVVSGAELDVHLPGQGMHLNIANGSASFKVGAGQERWTWLGTAELRKGKKKVVVDGVKLIADRWASNVNIQRFYLEGLGARLSGRGKVYPKVDLQISMNGNAGSLREDLSELGIDLGSIEGDFDLAGKLKGRWDRLHWLGTVRGRAMSYAGIDIPGFGLNVHLTPSELKKLSGKIDLAPGVSGNISIKGLSAERTGQFHFRADRVPFEKFWPKIIGSDELSFRGKLNINVSGQASLKSKSLKADYSVTVPRLDFSISPSLNVFLPLVLRNLGLKGEMGWSRSQGLYFSEGEIRATDLNGRYAFPSLKPGQARGDWSAEIGKVASVFHEELPISGSGRLYGGIKQVEKIPETILGIDLERLEYGGHPSGRFQGEIVFESGGTTRLRDFRLGIPGGSVLLSGRFPGESVPDQGMRLDGTIRNFNLGWIADVAARRYPLLPQIRGVGSGSISLEGDGESPSGRISVLSRQAAIEGNRFTLLDLSVDLADQVFVLDQAKFEGNRIGGTLGGALGPEGFRQFVVKADRIPLEVFQAPTPILALAESARGELELDGPLENPAVAGQASFWRANREGQEVQVGSGTAQGRAAQVECGVDFTNGTATANGVLDVRDFSTFDGEGVLRNFSLEPYLEGSEGLLSASWKLKGNFRKEKSWNGSVDLTALSLKKGDWKIGLKSPSSILFREGGIRLDRIVLSDETSDLSMSGSLSVDDRVSGEAEGEISLQPLALLPIGS